MIGVYVFVAVKQRAYLVSSHRFIRKDTGDNIRAWNVLIPQHNPVGQYSTGLTHVEGEGVVVRRVVPDDTVAFLASAEGGKIWFPRGGIYLEDQCFPRFTATLVVHPRAAHRKQRCVIASLDREPLLGRLASSADIDRRNRQHSNSAKGQYDFVKYRSAVRREARGRSGTSSTFKHCLQDGFLLLNRQGSSAGVQPVKRYQVLFQITTGPFPPPRALRPTTGNGFTRSRRARRPVFNF